MTERRTFLFMPESAHGPTNNRIDLAPPEPAPGPAPAAAGSGAPAAGRFWIDFIRDPAPEFREPTIDALATFIQPTWPATEGARIRARDGLRRAADLLAGLAP